MLTVFVNMVCLVGVPMVVVIFMPSFIVAVTGRHFFIGRFSIAASFMLQTKVLDRNANGYYLLNSAPTVATVLVVASSSA
jgi:hypothetical protein